MGLKRRVNSDYHDFILYVKLRLQYLKRPLKTEIFTHHVLFSNKALDVTIREGFLEGL